VTFKEAVREITYFKAMMNKKIRITTAGLLALPAASQLWYSIDIHYIVNR
jgi:hypothetical protein